ncbi:MAG: pyridoxal phosphate-dependent aminotransferase [Bacteroidales bacterium]|nr:pyridoxal phosphate-dependent aminotransferase [Bacteroidales bacterium]
MMYNFDQITDRRGTNSVKWDETSDPDVLPLWVADMDFPTAPAVQEAIVRRATHGCFGYTLVPDAYYKAIQDWFATRHQWNIEREHILFTTGVIPAIASCLKAICQTGDNVVLLTPVYNCFFNLIRNAGCQAIEEPLLTSKCVACGVITYDIDWAALEADLSLEKTTVLLFCNPHNPAGRLWSEAELTRVCELCRKYGVTLISDEIHNELTAPDTLYTPVGPVAERFNLRNPDNPLSYVVCTSPSKSFNTAGLQNANIMVPDPELRRKIDRAINLNEVCDVNPFGVEATIAAYNEGGEWLDAVRAYIYNNYRYARKRLLDAFPALRIAEMQGTYLMWVDCSQLRKMQGKTVARFCEELKTNAKVWFCAGSIYGKAGEGFIRINLACPRTTLTEALNRFIQYVE